MMYPQHVAEVADEKTHERPYLFSAPLVRAILDGSKTVTRRPLRGTLLVPPRPEDRFVQSLGRVDGVGSVRDRGRWLLIAGETPLEFFGPPRMDGVRPGDVVWRGPVWPLPGDGMWVKETWRVDHSWDKRRPSKIPATLARREDHIFYEATGETMRQGCRPGRIRPSMFMTRWASRITRKIVSMGVERLQDITEEQSMLEGVVLPDCDHDVSSADDLPSAVVAPDGVLRIPLAANVQYIMSKRSDGTRAYRHHFAALWNMINKDKPGLGWSDNPLVVVTTFEGP